MAFRRLSLSLGKTMSEYALKLLKEKNRINTSHSIRFIVENRNHTRIAYTWNSSFWFRFNMPFSQSMFCLNLSSTVNNVLLITLISMWANSWNRRSMVSAGKLSKQKWKSKRKGKMDRRVVYLLANIVHIHIIQDCIMNYPCWLWIIWLINDIKRFIQWFSHIQSFYFGTLALWKVNMVNFEVIFQS